MKSKKRRSHNIFFYVFLLVLLAIIGCGLYVLSSLQQIENHPLTQVATNNPEDKNMDDYTNLVVYGVDSRANDLKKNTRSDSIILVSIHNKTHKIRLTSIYRDTYVKIKGHGLTKINHAYAYGGPDLAVNTLNTNFDLNVKDFITVNFSALTNVIDDLGGITLHIKADERKWVNAYARDVAKINGKDFTKIKHSGTQTVTGVQATGYCRVRYTAGGDFTRAKRQRTVLKAIFKKAKKTSPLALMKVFNTICPQVYTSLSTSDILLLAKDLPAYEIVSQKGFPYKLDCHRASDGIYYDFPVTLKSNVIHLHKKLFAAKDYVPSAKVKKINALMGY